MKANSEKEKPIVNHRWNLPSLGEMLDHMPPWSAGGHPDFSGSDGYDKLRSAFERFAEDLLWQLSFSLEKAAAKGIEQALQLIRDPEYQKTVKRRTKRQIERDQKYQQEQDKRAAGDRIVFYGERVPQPWWL